MTDNHEKNDSNENTNSNSMWGGRFQSGPDKIMEAINTSIHFDKRLFVQDIEASKAHCMMLLTNKILDPETGDRIIRGLEKILIEIKTDVFNFRLSLEDIHLNIEKRLHELIGDDAGRLHTARSRNDQVATDFRLWIRAAIDDADKYFYLADTDLFFHPEYFNWLEYIAKKMDYKKNDLRIITNNFNILPNKKYKLIPNKLFNLLSSYFPDLYNWEPPNNLNQILNIDYMKAGFAHGCGIIPIDPMKKIGGYNEEMIGYGPEDDLFNKRLNFFSRVY